ncbi:MAG TPA: UDP-N-acetylmuramoyl-tripeptide--D-alanyl-D-alanine ligase [Methylomirabilota bacterium]|nr:UDP-N-acetylmuramoyl-tripeptide--D-alanyl-D-alanine ligase [Methylomirabilota bacterium]
MQLTAAEAARLVSGSVDGDGGVRLTGAEVDSRLVAAGDLFVALKGSRSDGHVFVADALGTAAAALVRYDADLDPPPRGRALIRVHDPLAAYWDLAREVRARCDWRVAAVTGSVGKTTTKDMLAALLGTRFRVGASTGNRNSTLGLPAQLLSQPADLEVFVAEAGMSRAGELDTLGSILGPQLILYTRIAPVHAEFFPDLAAIARAKAELIPHLDPAGTLVVNADDDNQRAFPEGTRAAVLRYGAADADGRLSGLEDRGLLGTRFRLHLPTGEAEVELPLAGRHQAENLLAAATAAAALGVAADDVAGVAAGLEPAPHRGRVHRLAGGVVVVDDSYNASPVAMSRLLGLLAAAPGRRVAVLGEMYELGEQSEAAHRRVGREAAAACDLLVATGGAGADELARAARDAGMPASAVHRAADADAAGELVGGLLEPGDVVLVKGSRGVGLDRAVEALLGREAA